MLVLATLGAPERRRLSSRRARRLNARPEPDASPVATGRATVIDVGERLDERQAAAWLDGAGEQQLEADLAVLNRALHSFRLASADPYLNPVERHQVLVARIGYGLGEQVADGLWTHARELVAPAHRQRRAKVLHPQARVAALLGGRERPLACEELTLRARLDLEQGRDRESALQLLVALDAAIAELPSADADAGLGERVDELREQRDAVARAAQAALAGPLEQPEFETVTFVLGRIEAALRAYSVGSPKLSRRWWRAASS